MIRTAPAFALAALLLASCASSLHVTEIRNDAPAGTKVDGIPFRVPRAYTVKLYQLRSDKNLYTPVANAPPMSVTAPNMGHLYVLGFEGQPLSNPTVSLTLNSDNTIQNVSLSSSPSGQAALTAISTQMTAVNGAFTTNHTAKNSADTAYAATVTAYYTAMQAYCKASTASPLDRDAVRTAAAGVKASEITYNQARETANASDTPPFSRLIDPQSDVGFGCASVPAPASS